MSEKRTVMKSIQVNVFSDGGFGLMVSPGTSNRDCIGMLHAALGIAIRNELNTVDEGNGNGKKRLVVVPGATLPKKEGA